LEVQNRNNIGIHEFLEHCERIQGCSIFQFRSQNVEEVRKIHQEGHVYHRPQLGGQPIYIHQDMQRTHRNVEDPLQHSQDNRFIQHPIHSPQIFQVQDARKRVMTCWTTLTRSRRSQINTLIRSIRERRRHCHDNTREVAGFIRIFDHRLEDDANERTYDRLHTRTFDAQDVKTQGEKVSR
jgi:hypothetical protein